MMRIELRRRLKAGRKRGLTLVEALVALAIAGLSISALVAGFMFLLRRAESSSYSLAAGALALEGYERVRAAKWDALSYPNTDEAVSSNFPPFVSVLDIPRSGSNIVYATNFTTITTLSTNPLLKAVRVDCVYRFHDQGLYTNSMVSYRATETGQQNLQESLPPTAPTLPPPTGTGTSTNSRSIATNVVVKDPTVTYTSKGVSVGGKRKR